MTGKDLHMAIVNILSLCILIAAQLSCVAGITVTSDKAGSFLGVAGTVGIHLDKRKPLVQQPVIRFLGVPYAKPPTGTLRFRRPEPLDKLTSTFNATFQRPFCQQMHDLVKYFQTSEDCLVMNMYVPGSKISNSSAYPVMIWIHGGAFYFGGAYVYSGDVISALGGVIVVVVQYRLNAFGFLSDGVVSSGNFGLWDQKMAIQWVHDNIQAFGGDPTSVTLFGQSAGGASVLYQALHPGNAGLFSRVIAESGSPLATWARTTKAGNNFQAFAARIGCDQSVKADAWECLRAKETIEILANVKAYSDSFVPFVDGDFILEPPLNLISGSRSALAQFASIDFLTGITSNDAAMFVTDVWGPLLKTMGLDISAGVPREVFIRTFLPESLQSALGQSVTPGVLQAVVHEYTDWKAPDDVIGIRGQMIDISTDLSFLLPAVTMAKTHSNLTEGTPRRTFFYEFDYKPSFDPQPSWLRGARHGAEVPFVFGLVDELKVLAGIPPNYTKPFMIPDQENYLALVMMTMWTNFAKTGNPNSDSLTDDNIPTWSQYDPVNGTYFRFLANMTSSEVTSHHIAASRVAFWTDLVPVLLSGNNQTSNCTQQEKGPTSASLRDKFSFISSILLLVSVALCHF